MRFWLLTAYLAALVAASAAQAAPEAARVAIYKDDIPASGAPASPDYLARLLDGSEFRSEFLNSEGLADARSQNPIIHKHLEKRTMPL